MIDSRASREGRHHPPRRECIACGYRFTTYEEIERPAWWCSNATDAARNSPKKNCSWG